MYFYLESSVLLQLALPIIFSIQFQEELGMCKLKGEEKSLQCISCDEKFLYIKCLLRFSWTYFQTAFEYNKELCFLWSVCFLVVYACDITKTINYSFINSDDRASLFYVNIWG